MADSLAVNSDEPSVACPERSVGVKTSALSLPDQPAGKQQDAAAETSPIDGAIEGSSSRPLALQNRAKAGHRLRYQILSTAFTMASYFALVRIKLNMVTY